MRTAILAAALLLTGCVGSATDAASDAATGSATGDSSATSGCTMRSDTPISWSAPGGAETPPDAEESFEVPRGATLLSTDWTDPTMSARGYSITISDPDGEVVFERSHDGVQAGGSTISAAGNSASSESSQTPPPPGTYTFAFHANGPIEGAALSVNVEGCW